MYFGIHFTGFEYVGKVSGFFDSEIAGDRRLTAFDLIVYVGGRVYFVVKNDSNLFAFVLAGDASPIASTLVVHAHGNFVAAHGVVVGRSVAHGRTVESSFASVGLEAIEGKTKIVFVAVVVYVYGRMATGV